MNIFITHKNPQDSARYLFLLDKRRANKMITESVQILSGAIKALHPKVIVPYKMQGNKSPMFWCMQKPANMAWLFEYTFELIRLFESESNSKRVIKSGHYKGKELEQILNKFYRALKMSTPDSFEPACLCERSSLFRFFNDSSVFDAYVTLLMEKIQEGETK